MAVAANPMLTQCSAGAALSAHFLHRLHQSPNRRAQHTTAGRNEQPTSNTALRNGPTRKNCSRSTMMGNCYAAQCTPVFQYQTLLLAPAPTYISLKTPTSTAELLPSYCFHEAACAMRCSYQQCMHMLVTKATAHPSPTMPPAQKHSLCPWWVDSSDQGASCQPCDNTHAMRPLPTLHISDSYTIGHTVSCCGSIYKQRIRTTLGQQSAKLHIKQAQPLSRQIYLQSCTCWSTGSTGTQTSSVLVGLVHIACCNAGVLMLHACTSVINIHQPSFLL